MVAAVGFFLIDEMFYWFDHGVAPGPAVMVKDQSVTLGQQPGAHGRQFGRDGLIDAAETADRYVITAYWITKKRLRT